MFSSKAFLASILLPSFTTLYAITPSLEEAREIQVDFIRPKPTQANFLPTVPKPIGEPEKEVIAPPLHPPQAQEFIINLKDPVFSQGVIKTDKGGVITGEGLRIQAHKIEYTNRIENGNLVKKVVAEGDLLMEYGGQAFVGSKLEYDFVHKTGILWDGKTYVNAWFLGGEKIQLTEDGSYFIYNAYITTCESQENTWDINAGDVKITKEHILSAHNISFRFIKIPVFWLPTFKWNLKAFKDPPIRYKLRWDKGLGPRITMRYRIFSVDLLNVYFRFDYRITKGPGAAVEADYHSPDNRTVFISKNYAAHDKSVPDESNYKRYRIQGMFDTISKNKKTQLHLQYDKFSDVKMPDDFKTDDFEVNTMTRTFLLLTHKEDEFISSLSVQPQVNRFQSIDQELPFFMIQNRPYVLGSSGIITENILNLAYLDYTYSRNLHPMLQNIHSGRFEMKNQLYRPIPAKYFTFTPNIGFIGIAYTNSFDRDAKGQAIFNFGGDINTRIVKHYTKYSHVIEPYANFQGYTFPTAPNREHFVFNLDDGYAALNLMRIGVRNTLYTSRRIFLPTIYTDLYTFAYLRHTPFHSIVPRAYLDVEWHLPSLAFITNFCYNIRERRWDYDNIRSEWTVNQHIAMAIEFRHRSKFDWRKADHQNFFLDVAHSWEDIVHSPVSDGRNTLLGRLFIRFNPRWSAALQTHLGWGRRDEPGYGEYKIDLFTMLTCNWRLRVGYEHMPNDDRFTAGLNLVK
jgi:hypothetical protein